MTKAEQTAIINSLTKQNNSLRAHIANLATQLAGTRSQGPTTGYTLPANFDSFTAAAQANIRESLSRRASLARKSA